jgi:hypothetical protein
MSVESNALTTNVATILWRGFVLIGHEACRLFSDDSNWHLQGAAVFSHEQHPCRLDYQIICNEGWQTRFASVAGWLGKRLINIDIKCDTNGRWWLNGAEQSNVRGCTDIDLNFSPSTNLLPIRRLNLAVGQAAELTAAWLRFPSFTLEPLPQRYSRLEETLYRYESGGGQFVADLTVSPSGFVINYPGIWQAEGISE